MHTRKPGTNQTNRIFEHTILNAKNTLNSIFLIPDSQNNFKYFKFMILSKIEIFQIFDLEIPTLMPFDRPQNDFSWTPGLCRNDPRYLNFTLTKPWPDLIQIKAAEDQNKVQKVHIVTAPNRRRRAADQGVARIVLLVSKVYNL